MRFSTYQQLRRNFYHCAHGWLGAAHQQGMRRFARQANHRRASHDLELRR
jgi:hypothetical protein